MPLDAGRPPLARTGAPAAFSPERYRPISRGWLIMTKCSYSGTSAGAPAFFCRRLPSVSHQVGSGGKVALSSLSTSPNRRYGLHVQMGSCKAKSWGGYGYCSSDSLLWSALLSAMSNTAGGRDERR